MEIGLAETVSGDYVTDYTDIKSGSTVESVNLKYPSFIDRAFNKMKHMSVMIDNCLLMYRPQCPMNSEGCVRVRVYDNRLCEPDCKQAEFVFSVSCCLNMTFFGNAYASLNDKECPWSITYVLENSNIKADVNYCKMKAFLKLSTVKRPNELPFRGPVIDIHSKLFSKENVDVWHCGYKKPTLSRCLNARPDNIDKPKAISCGPGDAFSNRRAFFSQLGWPSLCELDSKSAEAILGLKNSDGHGNSDGPVKCTLEVCKKSDLEEEKNKIKF